MSKTAIGWLYFIGLILSGITLFVFFLAQSGYNYWGTRVDGEIRCEATPNTPTCYESRDHYIWLAQQDGKQRDMNGTIAASAFIGMVIGGLLTMSSWIGTLINLSRGQQWAWFVLTFLFGGILIFIYLIGGPPVPKAGQVQPETVNLSPGEQPSPPPAYQQVSPQVYQSQPSALEVLQLRLARGEIDEQTYQRLRETLKA